jgi:hypothetical protein
VNKARKWSIAIGAAGGAMAICAGVASAAVLTAAPRPGNYTLYGCISGSSRALEHVYTSASAFKACPRGSTAVAFNSTGPQGKQGPPGPAGPAGASAPGWRAEVDNGVEFSVADSPNLADTSAAGATYSDAGVVVNIGTVGNLASADTTYTGTVTGGTLAENIWIGDGPQASTPGVYLLASVDFCYGLGEDPGKSGFPTAFYMTGANCTGTDDVNYSGDSLTPKQIAADFPSAAGAYEWVGVTNASAPVSATIASVAGQHVNAKLGITKETSGALFSFVSG